jgi:hypothetical protein
MKIIVERERDAAHLFGRDHEHFDKALSNA